MIWLNDFLAVFLAWLDGFSGWVRAMLGFCILMAVLPFAGCAGWNAQATEGTHTTKVGHGLYVKWGTEIYIGPRQDSETTVVNKFEGDAHGEDADAPAPE